MWHYALTDLECHLVLNVFNNKDSLYMKKQLTSMPVAQPLHLEKRG